MADRTGSNDSKEKIKTRMPLGRRILDNKWTWVIGSTYALFGLFNLTGISVYGWVNSFIRRAFIENSQMHDMTLSALVSINPGVFVGLTLFATIALCVAALLTWKAIRAWSISKLIWPVVIVVVTLVIVVLTAQVAQLIPMSFGQGIELFAILVAFLIGLIAFLVIGSQAYRNYVDLNVGYILIPVIILLLQGLWLYLCHGIAILPRPSFNNFFVSSQVAWVIIFSFGYKLLKMNRVASGQVAATTFQSESDQDQHANHGDGDHYVVDDIDDGHHQ